MTKFDVEVSTAVSKTVRVQQLSAAFDVPLSDRQELRWSGDLPLDEREWTVGMIVGPSGSGKTTILNHVFGSPLRLRWKGEAVVDDFPHEMSIEDVTEVCGAVGFNTIPAWMRPHKVLSTGEQFRVSLARSLVETPPDKMIVIDEFTSVVDRQVAKIGADAAQRWARKHEHRLVVATCHYDVEDWLQPDWMYDPASREFTWRSLQRRPEIACRIERCPRSEWARFARFHYLTPELHPSARCFECFVGDTPVSFYAVINRPRAKGPKSRRIVGVSRVVTLPDWQGLGLNSTMSRYIASAFNALRVELHTYPAHPVLIHRRDRDPNWEMIQAPGRYGTHSAKSTLWERGSQWVPGRRPNAVFRYIGPPMEDVDFAKRFIGER